MAYLGNILGIGSSAVSASASAVTAFTNTYSVDFDGTDDYAAIADANDLSFGNGSTDSAFSISAWIKMDDATKFRIISKTNSTSDAEWFFTTSGSDKLRIDLLDADNNNRIGIETDAAITAHEGSWISVIATYDGGGDSSTMVLYINGVAQATSAIDTGSYTAMHNTAAPVWIGGLAYGPDFANGKIDEVAIIPSELSAAQVTTIYNSGEPADLTSYSPTLWTRFEEGTGTSIADSSGNGHTATLTNGPTFSTDVPVYVFSRYSVDFDGTDDYATIADADDLSFGNGSTDSAFSISAWVKMDDATNFRIAAKTVSTNNREWLFTTDPNDKFSLTLYDPDAANSILSRYDTALTSFEGQWIHVCGTYDGSGNNSGISLYLNGSPVATVEVTSGSYVAMSNTAADVTIGRWNVSGYANGKIDEFAIIPSELSAAQITAIYNSGEPADLTSYSPTVWTRFEEGTGTSIADSSGNGHTATLTNGPTFSTDVPT